MLTVWEGPANIQALELLRLLAPRNRGWEQYRDRVRRALDGLPETLGNLRQALEARFRGDSLAAETTLRDEQSAQRYARKLLHRMSQSLAFALLCEAAGDEHPRGNSLAAYGAWRFYEDIEPAAFGEENEAARRGVLESLEEEALQTMKQD